MHANTGAIGSPPHGSPTRRSSSSGPRSRARSTTISSSGDDPLGVHFQFDATDFLEAAVQQYLRLRPTEVPISQPRGRARGLPKGST